ncbi:MAG TPA: AmmeMemoRadiSam system protein A [Sphaerochaeta sp.]|nr:AmmeMemoRadiSam system protein A [Sphaerochaeta sp.]
MKKKDKQLLLHLAREAIESVLYDQEQPLYAELLARKEPPYTQRRGCFVTLRTADGALRGCIGNILGRGEVVHTVVTLAKEAAFSDPRFAPLTAKEWEGVTIEISLLTKPTRVASYQEVVAGRDGVILTYGANRAVFLPQVATEQGWDRETLLSNLSMKAGLMPEFYTHPECRWETFQAEVFGET